jgi:hypothetical protein
LPALPAAAARGSPAVDQRGARRSAPFDSGAYEAETSSSTISRTTSLPGSRLFLTPRSRSERDQQDPAMAKAEAKSFASRERLVEEEAARMRI